jgi:hypothetical protein
VTLLVVAITALVLWGVLSLAPQPEGGAVPAEPVAEEPTTASRSLTDFEGVQWYVSPDGVKDAKGTMEQPLDLATALSKDSNVAPGDIVWLKGGTYKGNFVSELRGAEAGPILVRQSPGEHAIISPVSTGSPALTVKEPYVWFADFEIMNPNPERFAQTVAVPFSDGVGVKAEAPHLKFVNLIIHDLQSGIVIDKRFDGIEVYGSLIYYNGWQRADETGEGHGINTPSAAANRTIRNNIIFGQFGHGIYCYGASTDNLVIEDNTLFNNGGPSKWFDRNVLVGSAALNLMLRRNRTYYTPNVRAGVVDNVNIGYGGECRQTRILDNYFTGGNPLKLGNCEPTVMRGNTLSGHVDPAFSKYEKSNTMGPLTGVKTFVTPNQFERGRGHVTIYNWDRLPKVTADLSILGLNQGEPYEIRDAQNFYGPAVHAGTFDGTPVSLSLIGLSAAEPIGKTTNPPPPTGREFAVFVVVNTRTAAPAAKRTTGPTPPGVRAKPL